MNFRKKLTLMFALTSIALGTGGGFASWQYSASASSSHDHSVSIGNFVFNTLNIEESEGSKNGTYKKEINNIHNYRCDGEDLGWTYGSVDLNNYFDSSIVEGVESAGHMHFKVQSGYGSISGSTLTATNNIGNVVVRAYEEGYEDNYLDLTFTFNSSNNQAQHSYSHNGSYKNNEINWNPWSEYTSVDDNYHTHSRTGSITPILECSVCHNTMDGTPIEIACANFSSYSQYDTTGLGCSETKAHNNVQQNQITSEGSWVYDNASQHKKVNTTTTYYECSDCKHTSTKEDESTIYEDHNYERRISGTTITYTCSGCGHSFSSTIGGVTKSLTFQVPGDGTGYDLSQDFSFNNADNTPVSISDITFTIISGNSDNIASIINGHYLMGNYKGYEGHYGTVTVRGEVTNNSSIFADIEYDINFEIVDHEHDWVETSRDKTSDGSWSNYSATQHRRRPTYSVSYKCSICGATDTQTEYGSYTYESHSTSTSTSYGSWSGWSSYNSSYHRRYRSVEEVTKCSKCSYSTSETLDSEYQQEAHDETRTTYKSAYDTSTSWGSWSSWTTTKAATCTTTGTKTRTRTGTYYHYTTEYKYTCDICGGVRYSGGTRSTRTETDTETDTIPALGHSYGSAYYTYSQYNSTYHVKYRSQECTRCENVASSTIGNESHTWVTYNGGATYNCSKCGAARGG